MEPEQTRWKASVACEDPFQRVHDGVVPPAVAGHDEAPSAAAVDQQRPELGVLFAQFVSGIFQPARSEVAVQFDLDGPTTLVDDLASETSGLDRHRSQLTRSAVDFRAAVGDQWVEIGRP